ncbi:MAG: glycosyltransferase family 4 protein [Gemmatimonadota bacterium]
MTTRELRVSPIPRANYISNLSLDEVSGGWSGFNAAIYKSLSRHFKLDYVGPISPPPDGIAKVISKIHRTMGNRGSFPFFSRRRLESVSAEVRKQAGATAQFDFFHGSTPWVAYEPAIPYACYLDVCFATYMDIYHDRSEFEEADLKRIVREETRWLERADRVFFSSRWALERCAIEYKLSSDTFRVAGMGAYLPIPERDSFAGGHDFLFIALDFDGKGGRVCADAFRIVRDECPDATLRVIGAQPPADVLDMPGVSYEGILDKSVPADLERLQHILATSFALVHPTTRDATPQVVIEAQYHGCPVVAPRSFGIPEMVVDTVTGCLVEAPPSALSFAERMLWLVRNPVSYRRMRMAARANSIEHFTWAVVGDRIALEMMPVIT